MRPRRGFAPSLAGIGAAAALGAIGAAAVAQERMVPETEVEALVVIGHKGPPPEGPRVSYPVGFRDLDLRTEAGKNALTHRVAITATYVCNKLGGMDRSELQACRERAYNDGMEGAREVVHLARAHGVTWPRGLPWKPPPGTK